MTTIDLPRPAALSGSGLPAVDEATFNPRPSIRLIRRFGDDFGSLVTTLPADPAKRIMLRVPPPGQHVLTYRLSGAATSRIEIDGRVSAVTLRPGDLTLVPAGVGSTWEVAAVGQEILHLHLAPAWLDALAEEMGVRGTSADLPVRLNFADDRLSRTMRTLSQARAAGSFSEAPDVELIGLTAAADLLRATLADPGREMRRYSLAPAARRRVLDLIEERMADRLSLADMAAAARLSPFHFARAFRADMGESPAAYLMSRRCERARTLVIEGRLTLAEIATVCGFAHQAHFTTAFKRATGITPGRLRRVGAD